MSFKPPEAGLWLCSCKSTDDGEVVMISLGVENLGTLRVVECCGGIAHRDAAFALRDNVTAQVDARVIVLDLSEVNALEEDGLEMLILLQRWAHDHRIQLKVFNPRSSVRARLERTSFPVSFEIVSLEEVLHLVREAEHDHSLAA
jgi:anti-anti-sigma regulatory factor